MSQKHLQSVLFPKDKFTVKQAEQWLERHNLKHYKFDITENKIRARQQEPQKNAKYATHTLKNGIELILQYDPVEIKIVKADDNKHKYMAIIPKNLYKNDKEKHVKFGAIQYEDYTTHHDQERMKRYTQRHINESKFWDTSVKENIFRPSFWAKQILWNDQTSDLKKAVQLTSKSLGLSITLSN